MEPTKTHTERIHPLIQKYFIIVVILSLLGNTAVIFLTRYLYQAPTGPSMIDIFMATWPLLLLVATFLLRPMRQSKLMYVFEVAVLAMATVTLLNLLEYITMLLSSTNVIKIQPDFWPIAQGCAIVLYIAALAFLRFGRKRTTEAPLANK